MQKEHNVVSKLKVDGYWVEDQDTLVASAVCYFQELPTSEPHTINEDLLSFISSAVGDDQNALLASVSSATEIR